MGRGDPGVELLAPSLVRLFRRCSWCRGFLPKGKRSWCSAPCVEAWQFRNGDAVVVDRVLRARDREVCQLCGIDLRLLQRILDRLVAMLEREDLAGNARRDAWYAALKARRLVQIASSGPDWSP